MFKNPNRSGRKKTHESGTKFYAVHILNILENYSGVKSTGEIICLKVSGDSIDKNGNYSIQYYLKSYYEGQKIDRNTITGILGDLCGLEESDLPQVRCVEDSSGDRILGYYIDAPKLNAGEYAFLSSLIQYAPFLQKTTKEAIQKKILTITDETYSKTIGRAQIDAQNDILKPTYAISNAEMINKAITSKLKISFSINEYRFDKKLHQVEIEKDVVFSPYEIVATNNFLFVIGKREGERGLSHYRIDKLSRIKPSTEYFEREIGNVNTQKYINEHPFMSEGKRTVNRCVMNVQIDSLGEIIDEFGLGIDIQTKIKGEKIKDGYCRITIPNVIEEDMCKWALMHADIAEVLEPQELRYYIQNTSNVIRRTYSKNSEDKKLRVMDIGVRGNCLQIGHSFNPSMKDSKDFDSMLPSEKIELIKRIHINKSVKTEFLHLDKYVNTTELQIVDTPISSIDFAKGYKKLKRIVLVNTEVNDLRPLRNCPNLESIVLLNNKAANYEAICMLKSLRHLTIDEATSMVLDVDKIKENNPDILIECRTMDDCIIM